MLTHRAPLLLALLLCAVGAESAQGGLSSPNSWQRVSDDGQFVLVMISPWSVEDDAKVRREAQRAEILRLRGTYSQSGLYRNDGSTEPVWTIAYAGEQSMFLSSDGKYLVLADPSWHYGHVALFFANGKLLKRCSFSDLARHYLPIWKLRGGVSCSGLRFDEQQQTFTVSTNQGEAFVFDITTGNLIRSSSRYPLYLAASLVLLMGLGAMGFGFRIARRPTRPDKAGLT
ncbi:hypothetical protein NA78x_006130 [Anatilimnocola sp. NA78]|uniref:hypothetical protein n=1 Tax=Anatilimnocola sp. NA78 TaxID=3415683 RepID=UPI003CE5363B